MTLLGLFQIASAALLAIAVASGAWRMLPGPTKLARLTLVVWASGLAVSASLILLSPSEAVERGLIFLAGMALAAAVCSTGVYIRQLGPLATSRTDISQEAIDLYVASAQWTGVILICISLALLPLALLFAIWSP